MKYLQPLAILFLVGLCSAAPWIGNTDEPGGTNDIPGKEAGSLREEAIGAASERGSGPVEVRGVPEPPEPSTPRVAESSPAQFEFPSPEGWDSVVTYSFAACDHLTVTEQRRACLMLAFDAFLDDGMIMDIAAGLELSE